MTRWSAFGQPPNSYTTSRDSTRATLLQRNCCKALPWTWTLASRRVLKAAVITGYVVTIWSILLRT